MKSKKQIRALIARAKDAEARSGGTLVIPAWMKDEKKVLQNRKMTPAEQQEFNSMLCEILRSSVALVYLSECQARWGEKHGAPVFISGDISLGITSKVIEQALISHIEPLVVENSRFPVSDSVLYFYMGHELNNPKDRKHLTDIIDDVFTTMCEEIRANDYQMLPAATVH
ncbi:hypothetical protein [Serratia proteamaculans]|uniref:hypothetical protein n=1 Tax=Serratia proteamaculans TaxID=28151 RepID=UPI00217BFF58|nr:hypothetical protein [Serratia proteamaculans]CAI0984606.1 Uncharacterised protein [Serratia proteamaculans]